MNDYSSKTDKDILDIMTDKQKVFVNEYLISFNGVKAAKEAGYSIDSCRQLASDTLSKPYIKEYVSRRIKEIISQTDDKRAFLVQFWTDTILDDDASEGIKMKASENLAKYMTMFTERIEVSGDITATHFVIEGNEQD